MIGSLLYTGIDFWTPIISISCTLSYINHINIVYYLWVDHTVNWANFRVSSEKRLLIEKHIFITMTNYINYNGILCYTLYYILWVFAHFLLSGGATRWGPNLMRGLKIRNTSHMSYLNSHRLQRDEVRKKIRSSSHTL